MNEIHRSAELVGEVKLGNGNRIGPNVVIYGPVEIGDDNLILPSVVIGTPPQWVGKSHDVKNGRAISIGSRNTIRELVAIHKPEETVTAIGNDCYLMTHTHIAHDCIIGDKVTMASGCQLGGFTTIQKSCVLGFSSVTHPHVTMGAYSIIGMGTVVNRDIMPFLKIAGNPCRILGINRVGMVRGLFTEEEIVLMENHWVDVWTYLTKKSEQPTFLTDRLKQVCEDFASARHGNKQLVAYEPLNWRSDFAPF